jgi:hypothetical protein
MSDHRRKARNPLDGHFAAGRIGRDQYLAGKEFRRHYQAAQPGDPNSTSAKWLAKVDEELGEEGSAVVRSVLIAGMTMREVAVSRGKTGSGWESYFSKRFLESLGHLSIVFGFAKPHRTDIPDLTMPQPIRVSTISR